ncbi:hypothetical protein AAHE18_18G132700 [Arachis hypogaea]
MFCPLQMCPKIIRTKMFMIITTVPHKSPTINMSAARTLLGTKPAPVIAAFSSRGPNPIQPSILKQG